MTQDTTASLSQDLFQLSPDRQTHLVAAACKLIDAFLDDEAGLAQSNHVPARSSSDARPSADTGRANEGGPALTSVTLNALGAALDVSPFSLQRAFKRAMGISPREYANAKKMERLRAALKQGSDVAQASYAAGYGSIRALYEQAGATLGMSPGTYKKGGAGVTIAYAIAPCHLDLVLLAATDQGICFLAFGPERTALIDALRAEFPKAAQVMEDAALLQDSLEDVLRYLSGDLPDPDLPLDIQATAFQRRVWRELWAIPPGETRSYSQIAEKLGMDAGQRAVARACASNNVSLIIPCHRVVRGDGGLGGYRWGISRKKLLLALENKNWNNESFALTADKS